MRRSQIIALLNDGSSLVNFPFRVYFRKGEGEIAVSVPKRNFKRAVHRNLVRRRIREAYRIQKELYPFAGDCNLLIVYIAKEILDYQVIESNVASFLQKICGMASDKVD